jgi:hypothetical protein
MKRYWTLPSAATQPIRATGLSSRDLSTAAARAPGARRMRSGRATVSTLVARPLEQGSP